MNIHDFSHEESKVIVPPESIRQKLQIKAHEERVTYVSLVNESEEKLILTAGGDKLVRLWNYEGDQRGVLRQGAKENQGWMYRTDQKWQNKELVEFRKISQDLDRAFDEYLVKKRLAIIPFTEE